MFKNLSKNQRGNLIRKWKSEISQAIAEEYLGKFSNFNPEDTNYIFKLEKIFRCRIVIWGQESAFAKIECFRRSFFMPPENYDNFVDLMLPDNQLTLNNVTLLLDVDESLPTESRKRFNPQTWTLFECVAIQKNPALAMKITDLRETVKTLEEKWGRSSCHLADAEKFYKIFKMNLQIWNIYQSGTRNIFREKIFDRRGMPKLIGKVLSPYFCIIFLYMVL